MSTGRGRAHSSTTALVAHRNSVLCLMERHRRLGQKLDSTAISIGMLSNHDASRVVHPFGENSMTLRCCYRYHLGPRQMSDPKLIRLTGATTATIHQETPAASSCSDTLARPFSRILVGTMQQEAINASRNERWNPGRGLR